uniref:NADH dehydrogenase subunit 6 n=1 Tax=Dicrotendipes pelochloris TaxID=696198 RepID=UPI0022DCD9D6|nr:NADH dehydrogenase subunit 6 [Dicrotendipes pelochloris]WAB46402.1 NADH dehydrogenase subunit 6 [Dicrotendipes pelochloris]
MQNFLILILIISSLTFSLMNHPLSMGLLLMTQTILIALLTGILTKTFWFSYSLFLIFLGGMLILFMYMTSIASNEMFKFSINIKLLLFMMTLILSFMLFFLIFDFKMFFFNKIFNLDNMNFFDMKNLFTENNLTLNKLYNFPMNIITILLVNYLFLTLIATVKITNIFEGPLRPKN